MRRRTLALPLAALLAAAAVAQQAPPTPSLVTASGMAEAKAAPDQATLRFGVETQDKTAKGAQAATNQVMNRLIAAALKVVPDRKAYQTSDLSLSPQSSQPSGGGFGEATPQPPKIVAYLARNVLVVRVDDIEKVGPLIDAVTDAGATNVDSISFGLKDDKAARRKALVDAVRDARDKAEAMAAGLGLRLGSVYSVEEGGGSLVRPVEMMNMARMRSDSAPVMPGEVSLSASVVVRFVLVK